MDDITNNFKNSITGTEFERIMENSQFEAHIDCIIDNGLDMFVQNDNFCLDLLLDYLGNSILESIEDCFPDGEPQKENYIENGYFFEREFEEDKKLYAESQSPEIFDKVMLFSEKCIFDYFIPYHLESILEYKNEPWFPSFVSSLPVRYWSLLNGEEPIY